MEFSFETEVVVERASRDAHVRSTYRPGACPGSLYEAEYHPAASSTPAVAAMRVGARAAGAASSLLRFRLDLRDRPALGPRCWPGARTSRSTPELTQPGRSAQSALRRARSNSLKI